VAFDFRELQGYREGSRLEFKEARGAAVENDVGNIGNGVGNVVGTKVLPVTERAVLDAIQANPIATAKEIATAIGKSERQVERARESLRDAGHIERIGGTRGYWKVKR
jgi:ATP-dependent DNA helicase RecG